MSEGMYVIVAEKPGFRYDFVPANGLLAPPFIIAEQGFVHDTDIPKHSLAWAKFQLDKLPKRFGKCQIYKLVPVEV